MPTTDPLSELKDAVATNPGNAQLLYLLGAELAQQQQYDDATSALTSAIAIDPSLHTARLQLGLLHLTMARTEQSMAILTSLDALPDDDPIGHFARGLRALASDELERCVTAMRRGIALNGSNAALNKDMTVIVARIEELKTPTSENRRPDAAAGAPREAPKAKRTDFSLYKTIEDT